MLCIPIHQFYLNFLRLAILDDVLDNKEVVVVALREREREWRQLSSICITAGRNVYSLEL